MKKIIALSLLSLSSSVMAQPEITAYYLSDTENSEYASLTNLEQFAHTITTNQKTNFNRLVLSFVQPSLQFYKPEMNSLQCTGLFGTFCDSEPELITYEEQQDTFDRLKLVIAELKDSGIETYIALGGWNFSCNPDYYDKTTGQTGACGPDDSQYDSFPNPLDTHPRFEHPYTAQQARDSYDKVVSLASSLGASGIDIDYEEFWHADMNAFSWNITPDSVPETDGVTYVSTIDLENQGKGAEIYDDQGNFIFDDSTPRIMPDTVDKYAAIIRQIKASIDESGADLSLSTAAPATGAIPTMSANWGVNARTLTTYGGAWWGGNLSGLIYNTALKYPSDINALSSIGIMDYDLSESDCDTSEGGNSDGSFIPCDLQGQELFYFGTFISWLKSGAYAVLEDGSHGSPLHAIVKGSPTYAANSIQPQKLLITPDINIGFEVGVPATGSLTLEKVDLSSILGHSSKGSKTGIIMWDLFKDVRVDSGVWQPTWASPQDVLSESCKLMGLSGEQYDCDINNFSTTRKVK